MVHSVNSSITKQCIALTVLKYKLKILAVEVLGHLLDTSDLKWKIDYSLAISNLDSFPSMNISTSASQSSQLAEIGSFLKATKRTTTVKTSQKWVCVLSNFILIKLLIECFRKGTSECRSTFICQCRSIFLLAQSKVSLITNH